MATSDFIAISILIVCAVLGVLGTFKWLLRFAVGIILGLMILVCLGLLADNPKFDQASRGIFKGGVVIPCMRNQAYTIGEFISRKEEASQGGIARNE